MDDQNRQGANPQNPNRPARNGQTRGNAPVRGNGQARSGAGAPSRGNAQQRDPRGNAAARSTSQARANAQARAAAARGNGQQARGNGQQSPRSAQQSQQARGQQGSRPAQQASRSAQAARGQQAPRSARLPENARQQAQQAPRSQQLPRTPQAPQAAKSPQTPQTPAAANPPLRGEVKVMGKNQLGTYDTSAIRPKKSKAPVIIVTAVILIALGVAGFFGWRFLSDRFGNHVELLPAGQSVEVTIPDGALASDIGSILEEARLVKSADDFYKRVIALEADTALRPGTYVIEGGTDMNDIIAMLKEGPGMTGTPLTIPEGYTRKAAAKAVETATGGRVTAKQFLNATAKASAYAADYPFLKEVKDKSLEGFLFPKTYAIQDDTTCDEIVRMMLDQYVLELEELDFSYPKKQGLSAYETLILASIVEKEATTSTKPQIAAVFYNRLSTQGDPTYGFLQSDATTAYEVGHDPTPEEVHADTPFSTYTHQGLCPTPICSPSLDAMEAVCNPDLDMIKDGYYYFYFADDENGYIQYYFSKTLAEHEAAIASH